MKKEICAVCGKETEKDMSNTHTTCSDTCAEIMEMWLDYLYNHVEELSLEEEQTIEENFPSDTEEDILFYEFEQSNNHFDLF